MESKEKSTHLVNQELHGLFEHQKQLKDWLAEVDRRIYELEGTYLEETPHGNLVRGWDIDNKQIMRPRQIEGNERIFSCSSYNNWMEIKSAFENDIDRKSVSARSETISQQPKPKKSRKSNSKRESLEDPDDDFFSY